MSLKYLTVEKSAAFHSASKLFRLKAWVTYTAYNIPPEVFLFQDSPTYPVEGYITEIFPSYRYQRVATYADMLNYPAGTGDDATVYFRRASVYLSFQTITQLNTVWTAMNTGLQVLVDEIAAVHAATPTVTVVSS